MTMDSEDLWWLLTVGLILGLGLALGLSAKSQMTQPKPSCPCESVKPVEKSDHGLSLPGVFTWDTTVEQLQHEVIFEATPTPEER